MNANIVDVDLIDSYRKTLAEVGASLKEGDLENAAAKLNNAYVYLGSIRQRKQFDDMRDEEQSCETICVPGGNCFDISKEFKELGIIKTRIAKRKEDPIYHLEQLMTELVRTENYESAAKVKKEIGDLKTRLEKQ